MPVRTRAKAALGARVQRLATQFGELETTPTSHHHRADQAPTLPNDDSRTIDNPHGQGSQSWTEARRCDDGFDDLDLTGLDDMQSPRPEDRRHSSFQWSETESMARRSSPLHPGETPTTAWQFDPDESLPPLSTPASGRDKLPDTAPLPTGPPPAPEVGELPASTNKVDFSETASTMRRSSPAGLGDSVKDPFDFENDLAPGTLATRPEESTQDAQVVQRPQPVRNRAHLPIDNIYDATPSPSNPRSRRSPQAASSASLPGTGLAAPVAHQETGKPNEREESVAQGRGDANDSPLASPSHHLPQGQKVRSQKSQPRQAGRAGAQEAKQHVAVEVGIPSLEVSQTTTVLMRGDKRKKPKQRPKPPLQFDEISHQLLEPQIRPKTKPSQKARMPIVSALRDSVQPPSPLVSVPRKRGAGKCPPPKKKAKSTSAKRQQQTPVAGAAGQSPESDNSSAPLKLRTKRPNQVTKPREAFPSPKVDPSIPVKGPDLVVVSSDSDSGSIASSVSEWIPTRGAAKCPALPMASPPHVSGESDLLPAVTPSNGFLAAAAVPELTISPPEHRGPDCIRSTEATEHREGIGALGVNVEMNHASRERGLQTAAMNPSPQETSPAKKGSHRPSTNQSYNRRTISRNFSISAHGSPLPVHDPATNGFPKTFMEPGNPKPNTKAPPFELHGSKRSHLAPREALSREAYQGQHAWFVDGQDDDVGARRSAQHRDPKTAPLPSISEHVHARILASLQQRVTSHDGHSRPDDATKPSRKCRDGSQRLEADSRPSPPDGLSQQLHRVVDALVRQLKSREEASHRVAAVYRIKTAGCIERISHRQDQERKVLLESVAVDAGKFQDFVQRAQSTVSKDSRLREQGIRGLEKNTAERVAMYEQAATSLRALHRQLLEGRHMALADGGQEDS